MEGYGLVTEIVSAVFKEMGKEPVYDFLPWKRCEESVKNGEHWGTFPYAITDERKEHFLFTDPISETRSYLFALKQISLSELADLKSFNVGGVRGNFYETMFSEAGIKLDLSNDEETAFKKLFTDRVDMVVAADAVGWYIIDKHFPEKKNSVVMLPLPLMNNEGATKNAIMVSKSYPGAEELIREFNEALKRIRENGVYAEILSRYGVAQ
jgi:polar amino acid transport system substrate-binding protein